MTAKIVIDYRDKSELEGFEAIDGARELLAEDEVTDADIERSRERWAGDGRSGPTPPRGPRPAK